MQFEKWHGRPAREATRKMRVPHQTASVRSRQDKLNVI